MRVPATYWFGPLMLLATLLGTPQVRAADNSCPNLDTKLASPCGNRPLSGSYHVYLGNYRGNIVVYPTGLKYACPSHGDCVCNLSGINPGQMYDLGFSGWDDSRIAFQTDPQGSLSPRSTSNSSFLNQFAKINGRQIHVSSNAYSEITIDTHNFKEHWGIEYWYCANFSAGTKSRMMKFNFVRSINYLTTLDSMLPDYGKYFLKFDKKGHVETTPCFMTVVPGQPRKLRLTDTSSCPRYIQSR